MFEIIKLKTCKAPPLEDRLMRNAENLPISNNVVRFNLCHYCKGKRQRLVKKPKSFKSLLLF